ncbi:MAG: hypothetical protein H0Z34_09405 [Brevibacillus sp.]|nr:hypothetical protein [Brevibacillus sp.]
MEYSRKESWTKEMLLETLPYYTVLKEDEKKSFDLLWQAKLDCEKTRGAIISPVNKEKQVQIRGQEPFNVKKYLQEQGFNLAIAEKMVQRAETFITSLETALNRNLTNQEKRKLSWLATCDWETCDVMQGMFQELASGHQWTRQARYDRER